MRKIYSYKGNTSHARMQLEQMSAYWGASFEIALQDMGFKKKRERKKTDSTQGVKNETYKRR